MVQDRANSEGSYQRFIEQVRETGEVWGLQSGEGWAYCSSNEWEETDVLMFWSDRTYAHKHLQGEWSNHKPVAIPLDEFVENWLSGMEEDGVLVGPNWDTNLAGIEVEPSELAEKLMSEDEDGEEED